MTATQQQLSELRLSQSMVYEWQRCRFMFRISTLEQLKPRFTPAPLRRGTLISVGLEAARRLHFEGEMSLEHLVQAGVDAMFEKHVEWMKEDHIKEFLDDEMAQSFRDQLDACTLIFKRALEFLGLHRGEWETVALDDGTPLIEHEMSVPMEGFSMFGGKLDWVARETATGNVWLWDDKTQKRLAGEEYFEAQLQAPAYQHLLSTVHGLQLAGTANYLIRAHVPAVPEMNTRKSKGQSKPGMSRKKISTDWDTYRAALIREGLDPADYHDFRDALSPFQRIDRYYRTPKEVAAAWETVLQVAQELRAAKVYPRSLSPFNCQGCKFKSYCLADLRGHDIDFLSRTEYMREGEAPFFPLDIIAEDEDQ